MGYYLYGKVIKPMLLPDGKNGFKHIEPQKTFRALNKRGQRVTKLADAYIYTTKEDAQIQIEQALSFWEKYNQEDCIEFEIRKCK